MNKVILLGRLTKAPDIRFAQTNNIKVANFTLAVNRKFVKPGEERQSDFINVVAYSKLADFTEKYLSQGLQICVSGRMQTRNYEDKNGIKRYVTEIVAEELYFADRPKNTNDNVFDNNSNTIAHNEILQNNDEDVISDDDDLPF